MRCQAGRTHIYMSERNSLCVNENCIFHPCSQIEFYASTVVFRCHIILVNYFQLFIFRDFVLIISLLMQFAILMSKSSCYLSLCRRFTHLLNDLIIHSDSCFMFTFHPETFGRLRDPHTVVHKSDNILSLS